MRPHDSQVPGHVPALDGLRGIAIAIVFLGHAVALQLTPAGVEGGLREVLRFGWSGVDLFFVLSGFLITGILLDSKGQPRWWPNFFMRRALRIFPLYYGALFLIFIVLPRLVRWHDPDYALLQANQAWYWGYAVNVLNALTNGHGTPLNTAHFWSLAIEEQYYLLWPLVVWLCRPRTLLRVALIASVIGVAFRLWLVANGRPEMAYGLTPGRLDGLLLGGALAVLAREAGGLAQWRPLALRVVTIALIAVAGTAALRGGFEYHDPVVAAAGYPVLALLYGGLLVLALSGSPTDVLSRTLRSPALRTAGKYSYGLYVIHYPLVGALERIGLYERVTSWLGGAHLAAVLLVAGLSAAATLALAWMSYHFYEKPFLDLKRFFETRRATPASSLAREPLESTGADHMAR